ncbi:MAG: DNA cytosine methyltransferase [Hyphomicrobium sp.]
MKAPEAYYNEIDPWAAQFVRNLIDKGYLPYGVVDERSIVDVEPDDLIGFTQCHFFAGIGGWGLATRLAAWPDWREIWTGSCPCQPFSVAGKGAGTADERHLWPDMFRLIRARRPLVVMGEQVAAAAGKHWLDGVLTDLEGADYASRALVLPACAVNAPHRRDCLWWVARNLIVGNGDDARSQGHRRDVALESGRQITHRSAAQTGGDLVLADAVDAVAECGTRPGTGPGQAPGRRSPGELDGHRDAVSRDGSGLDGGYVADAESSGRVEGRVAGATSAREDGTRSADDCVDVPDADSRRFEGVTERYVTTRREFLAQDGHDVDGYRVSGSESDDVVNADLACAGQEWEQRSGQFSRLGGNTQADFGEHWATDAWVIGYDGKARRVEPGIRLLAHGVSGRVAKLRAGGNAIVPQEAAECIAAFADVYPV